MEEPKTHWEHIYETKPVTTVSWFQEHARLSMQLVQAAGLERSASIIDVGGGASPFVDDLLANGFEHMTVLDISLAALKAAQQRLGKNADRVKWLEADVTKASFPPHSFDLWHDRAVFHFLTEAADRAAYVENVLRAVKPGGHVVVATFAEDGPTRCSGLPVRRYSAEELHSEFGASFTLVRHEKEAHQTPSGTIQQFVYCYCRCS